ncbi:MAG: DUF4469 domain-containing protein [Prolixibacteraceae bacterium]
MQKRGNLLWKLIELFTDMTTGEVNAVLTPGGPVVIKGTRLKFDADDPEQGVFLQSENRQLLRIGGVLRNVFSQIVLMVPTDLSPGAYQLIIKSRLNTQQIRTGELSHDLRVGG